MYSVNFDLLLLYINLFVIGHFNRLMWKWGWWSVQTSLQQWKAWWCMYLHKRSWCSPASRANSRTKPGTSDLHWMRIVLVICRVRLPLPLFASHGLILIVFYLGQYFFMPTSRVGNSVRTARACVRLSRILVTKFVIVPLICCRWHSHSRHICCYMYI